MTATSKGEYLSGVWWRYQRAGREHKGRILAEFCAVCGYERKWAIKLLNRPLRAERPRRGGAKRRYGEELDVLAGCVEPWAARGVKREVEAALPFKLLGLRESMEGAYSCALTLDSDNGGEFINQHLHTYLQGKQTRGRPYHKNDNAHVELK